MAELPFDFSFLPSPVSRYSLCHSPHPHPTEVTVPLKIYVGDSPSLSIPYTMHMDNQENKEKSYTYRSPHPQDATSCCSSSKFPYPGVRGSIVQTHSTVYVPKPVIFFFAIRMIFCIVCKLCCILLCFFTQTLMNMLHPSSQRGFLIYFASQPLPRLKTNCLL